MNEWVSCVRCLDKLEYRNVMRASFHVRSGRNDEDLDVCAAHLAWAVREFGDSGPVIVLLATRLQVAGQLVKGEVKPMKQDS